MQERFHSIQYLRGIAALMVVFTHLKEDLNGAFGIPDIGYTLFSHGIFGVDLFFVISGFIIHQSTQKYIHSRPGTFIVRRVFRIYPVFLFCVLAIVAIAPGWPQHVDLAKGLLFIPLNFADKAPFYGYNFLYPAWTLTYELLFYAIFVLAICISHAKRGLTASIIMISLIVILQIIPNNHVVLDMSYSLPYTQGIFKLLASPMLIEFIYGIALSALISKVAFTQRICVTISVVAFGAFIGLFWSGVANYHGPLQYGLAATALVISALMLGRSGYLPKLAMLDRLGDISYSLYLSHIITLFALKHYVLTPFSIDPKASITWFIVATSVSLLVSNLIFRFIEVRFIAWGKRLTTWMMSTPSVRVTTVDLQNS